MWHEEVSLRRKRSGRGVYRREGGWAFKTHQLSPTKRSVVLVVVVLTLV